jgi:hypothetical protein
MNLQEQEWLDKGLMPAGKYKSYSFDAVPTSYKKWVVGKEWDTESAMWHTASKLKEIMGSEPEPVNEPFGNLNERLEMIGKVVDTYAYPTYSRTSRKSAFCTKIRLNSGHIVKTFSAAFRGKEGEVIKFKATIKSHTVFDGVTETIVTRLAVQANYTNLIDEL